MSGTRKACPTVPTVRQAVENVAVCKAAQPSTKDSIISAADRQPPRIADFLHPGVENAISRRDLMALTGYKDRELRLRIEAERRQGYPILSDNVHGYFLPGDQSDRDRCVRSLRRRAKEIERTAAAIEKAVIY